MALFNHVTRELTAKVVYYGAGLSGKTTNLKVLQGSLEKGTAGRLLSLATAQDRTIYFDLLPVELGNIKGYSVRFQLCTVPGQVFYNETRKLVLKGVDGIVFVVDSQWSMLSHNLEAFSNLRENLEEAGIDLSSLPLVIQYNKRDLPGVLPVKALQDSLGFGDFPYVEAVASEGRGVVETFKLVSRQTFVHLLRKIQRPETMEGEGELLVPVSAPVTLPSEAKPPDADTVRIDALPGTHAVPAAADGPDSAEVHDGSAGEAADPTTPSNRQKGQVPSDDASWLRLFRALPKERSTPFPAVVLAGEPAPSARAQSPAAREDRGPVTLETPFDASTEAPGPRTGDIFAPTGRAAEKTATSVPPAVPAAGANEDARLTHLEERLAELATSVTNTLSNASRRTEADRVQRADEAAAFRATLLDAACDATTASVVPVREDLARFTAEAAAHREAASRTEAEVSTLREELERLSLETASLGEENARLSGLLDARGEEARVLATRLDEVDSALREARADRELLDTRWETVMRARTDEVGRLAAKVEAVESRSTRLVAALRAALVEAGDGDARGEG